MAKISFYKGGKTIRLNQFNEMNLPPKGKIDIIFNHNGVAYNFCNLNYTKPFQDKGNNVFNGTININRGKKNENIPLRDFQKQYIDGIVINDVEVKIPSSKRLDPINENIEKENTHQIQINSEGYTYRKTRIGQQAFRKKILKNYNYKCCITEMSDKMFLVASHIESWSDNPKERLNKENGLCLYTELDDFFDKYYLSFNNDLIIEVKNVDDTFLANRLNFYNGKKLTLPVGSSETKKFLKIHYKEFLKR